MTYSFSTGGGADTVLQAYRRSNANACIMSQSTRTRATMKKTISLTCFGWAFILILLYGFTDLSLPAVNQTSDYLMTFHTAGTLVREGQSEILYPATLATSFSECAFDQAAHRILPLLPAPANAEYMYMPLVAGFFVPFSLLPSSYSLLVWQVVSLCGLAFCAFLVSSYAAKKDEANGMDVSATWMALTLIPLAISIWIGQVSVVFGLLPFIGGLYLVLKGKDLPAGFVWSLAVFKPQFFIPVLMMGVALCAAKRFKPMIGIICGITIVINLNLVLFSPAMFLQWLHTLKLAEAVYSDLKFGVAQHLATSLPRAIILLVPVAQHAIVKPLVYALSAVLGGIGLYFASRLMRSTQLSDAIKISLAAIICVFATPIIVPHVFFYDYSIFTAAAFLAYSLKWPGSVDKRIKTLIVYGWVIVNVYGILVLVNKNWVLPLVFVLIMLEFYRRVIVLAQVALKEAAVVAAPVKEPENEDCCNGVVHIAYRGLSDDRQYIAYSRKWEEIRFFKENGLKAFCADCRRRLL